jgi:energy-coupling factor transporter ATP-binding protein EcfA2
VPVSARSVFEILGVTPEEWLALPRAGARAGRGFHFQDAALTLLLVRGLLGTAKLGLLVPEGRDDATLDLDGVACDAQVKSRQPSQPDFGNSEMAKVVIEVADRRDADRLLVILERGFPSTGVTRRAAGHADVRERLAPALVRRCGADRAEALLDRLSIVVEPDPLGAATAELATTRGVHPELAGLVVRSLCAAVATCVDRNALADGHPAALAVTDAAAIVDRTVELVDVAALDAALERGLCEAVEFTRTAATEEYLRGAATTPAHVASGLVLDRPTTVNEISAELFSRRRVLLTGPSGSGKSALVWLTVHATRHTVRWYRIRRLDEANAIATVDRLARVLGATPERPVGFVVDDAGRLGGARWDALISELMHRPGVLLLGAIREDSLIDLATLTDVALLRCDADEVFAEALWHTFRDNGDTTWAGWREPFERAEGLILEYVHLLTRGERLEELLADQVGRLAADHGNQLVSVLTFVTVADQLGVAMTINQLTTLTEQNHDSIIAAARRLQNEFLVQVEGQSISGLHELRSTVTARHATRVGYRTLDSVVDALLRSVAADELVVAVPRASKLMDSDLIVAALASRASAMSDVSELAASLEGLRDIEMQRSAEAVAVTLRNALSPGDILDVVQTRFGARIHDSVRMLWDAPEIPAPSSDLRQQLLISVSATPLNVASPRHMARLICALPPGDAPPWVVDAIANGMSIQHLDDVVELLDAVRAHGDELHRATVDALGGPSLAACATAAWMGFDLDTFEATGSSPHFRLLSSDTGAFWEAGRTTGGLVARILACSCLFENVRVHLVDAAGHAIPAMTRIPAIDKPISAEPLTAAAGKERWRAAILAAVGSTQWTARLDEERRLLGPLVTALRSYLGCLCRGTPISGVRQRFAGLDRAAERLTPPPATIALDETDADDHRIGARHEADPFMALLRHPGWHMLDSSHAAVVAYRLWRVADDLRNEHRWGLLPQDLNEVADTLVSTLSDLRLLLAEKAAMPTAQWSAMIAGARLHPKTLEKDLIDRARRSAQQRARVEARGFQESLRNAGLTAQAEIVAEPDAPGAVWPPTRLVLTVALANASLWPAAIETIMQARLADVSAERAVTVLVELNGAISGCLSGEAARAWWGRTDVLTAANVSGRLEPRGAAWRSALRAGWRVHAARAWREQVADVRSPLAALLDVAFDVAERRAAEARATLASFALEDAVTFVDEICDGETVDDARTRAALITAALADLDAAHESVS